VLAARVAARRGHYMPPSLLRSQLDALEPPEPDEGILTLDCRDPTDALVTAVAAAACETAGRRRRRRL
jgi:gluconokinase